MTINIIALLFVLFTVFGTPETDNLQIQLQIQKNFVVIDCETTALDSNKGNLLSILYNKLGLSAETDVHHVLRGAQLAMDIFHQIDLAVAEAVF